MGKSFPNQFERNILSVIKQALNNTIVCYLTQLSILKNINKFYKINIFHFEYCLRTR